MTETQIKNKEFAERALNSMLRRTQQSLEALAMTAQTYAEVLRELEEAQDAVLTAREDLKTVVGEYEADGASSEEIDETLNKYGLSCDDISNWE